MKECASRNPENVPEVPPVGDLLSVGCTVPGAVGVPTGPVPADHLHTGMETEPVGEVGGFPTQKDVDRSVPVGQIDQHRAVVVAAAHRELVDAQDRHLANRWVRQGADQPQQCRPAHPHPSRVASREPARPANANPTATSAAWRPGLRRA